MTIIQHRTLSVSCDAVEVAASLVDIPDQTLGELIVQHGKQGTGEMDQC